MATEPVSTKNMWPNYAKGNVSNKNGNGQELGKDQFLSILITACGIRTRFNRCRTRSLSPKWPSLLPWSN